MAIKELYEPECSNCGNFHTEKLICEDCIKRRIIKVFTDIDKKVFGISKDGWSYSDDNEYKKLKKKYLG